MSCLANYTFPEYLEMYSKKEWRVLPVSSKKVPLIRSWPSKASSELDIIQQWWKQYPYANVGLATGRESGFWVLDIDIKHGVNGLESISKEFKDFDASTFPAHVRSPSGGLHIYFQWCDDLPVTVAANVLPGVDIRGETGFIMAPPSSINIGGESKHYECLGYPLDAIPAPEWAIDLAKRTLSKPSPGTTRPTSSLNLSEILNGVSQGNRDTALFRYACHLRGCEIPFDLAVGFIQEAAARCIPPFDQQTALEKVERAYATLPKRNQIFSLKRGISNESTN